MNRHSPIDPESIPSFQLAGVIRSRADDLALALANARPRAEDFARAEDLARDLVALVGQARMYSITRAQRNAFDRAEGLFFDLVQELANARVSFWPPPRARVVHPATDTTGASLALTKVVTAHTIVASSLAKALAHPDVLGSREPEDAVLLPVLRAFAGCLDWLASIPGFLTNRIRHAFAKKSGRRDD